jgi:hypothetical protein
MNDDRDHAPSLFMNGHTWTIRRACYQLFSMSLPRESTVLFMRISRLVPTGPWGPQLVGLSYCCPRDSEFAEHLVIEHLNAVESWHDQLRRALTEERFLWTTASTGVYINIFIYTKVVKSCLAQLVVRWVTKCEASVE